MQSLTVFALLLEIVPALAGVSPFARRSRAEDREWTPARETPAPSGLADGGLSPAPTAPARPHDDFGEMDLFKRYHMGTDTCGFASGYKCAFPNLVSPFPACPVPAFPGTWGGISGYMGPHPKKKNPPRWELGVLPLCTNNGVAFCCS